MADRLPRIPAGVTRILDTVLVLIGLLTIWTVATVPMRAAGQAVFGVTAAVVFLLANPIKGRLMSLSLIALSCAVSLRYLVWRITDTLEFHGLLQGVLGTTLVLAEFYAVGVMLLGYIQTAWPLARPILPLPADERDWPSVDVYIPSYNESLAVVRATVLAALRIDYPADKLRVYILDDGRRAEFRDFAVASGAGYIIRPDNNHAKAGNLNHAVRHTDGELIAIFDCDHVPTRAFLKLTVGWLAADPALALVQTPHHFYSPDPFQRNLAAGTRVPSEGNMFYALVQDGNDLWNASFFCGSCAVIRRSAIDSIGGFATQTVTEDAHTALRLQRQGWSTAYLKLPLAAGLATERLALHIGQRMRWARGMIQILRTDNPLLGPGLKFGQRLCYINAMIHFLFAIPRLVFLTSPLAYLMLDQNIIAASPLAIAAYAGPHIFHAVATNSRIQGSARHSFWSEIYETVMAPFLVRLTLVTLISPKRGKFNVTDKGGLLKSGYFDMRAVYPNLLLAGLLAVGWLLGVFRLIFTHPDQLGYQALILNTFWITLSLLIVAAALAVGRETRQVRTQARVRAALPATIHLADGREIAGTTRELSLGGSSLLAQRPDGVTDGMAVRVGLPVGEETVIITARVQRWQAKFLQIVFTPATIEDESNIVQVVFGRTDAWADWDHFPRDRVLVSLWTVLLSIAGLFRRPGKSMVTPVSQTPPTAPLAESGAESGAKLDKQTLVLPPRAARLGQIACWALLVVAIALPAAAQTSPPMPAQPPMPTAPPSAAPAAANPAPATPPAAPQSVRHVTYTMDQLGAHGPMTMRGTSEIQGVLFGVRADEVVTSAELTLDGAVSPALIPAFSNVTVTLNEQYVGTIPTVPAHPAFGPLRMAIDPVFFQDSNRLNFRFTGRYTPECNDPLSGLLWATVSDKSTLTLTLARLPAQRELSRLPLPFFDPRENRPLVLPMVLPADPDNGTLQAAAIVGSWFGRLASFRGASFPVAPAAPMQGNAVLFLPGDARPPGIVLPPFTGPTLAVVANPHDSFGSLLVIGGRNPAELQAAAAALALGSRTLGGTLATVQAPDAPPRAPYDAPDWIPTDHPVRFGSQVDAAALQGNGYAPGTFRVPFNTAPDLYTWRRQPFLMDVKFRAPPGPIIDLATSRLDVAINGQYLRSYPLATPDPSWAWLARAVGIDPTFQDRVAAIPPYDVFGRNELQLSFDARPLHRGACVATPGDLHMSVDPDSTIDLSRAYRFAEMPNLAYMVNSGFPFTRMADLSQTAVVLPARPGPADITAFLDLMGYIGSITGYPALRVSVVRPDGLAAIGDRDILLMSTLAELGPAASLLHGAPVHVDGGHVEVALSTPLASIRRLFGDGAVDERAKLAVALSANPGAGTAMLVGAASPLHAGRSLVGFLAVTPPDLNALVDALHDGRLSPAIQGDFALLAGQRISSYRVGPIYTTGSLPFWVWPEYELRGAPLGMAGLLVVACFMIGIVSYWRLRRRAASRLAPPPRGRR
jgi:cellulose synthase (UDP-forming)